MRLATVVASALVAAACGQKVASGGGPTTSRSGGAHRGAGSPVPGPESSSAPPTGRSAGRGRARPTTPRRSTTAAAGSSQRAIAAAVAGAWRTEIDAFYVASERGDPSYGPMLAGVVPGDPEQAQMVAFVSAQVASGVAGPSTWRIGEIRVVAVRGSNAVVEACATDPGSHEISSGTAAPPLLGGGAGLTAFVSDLAETGGSWKLVRTATSAPSSIDVEGPCHGF